MGAADMPFFGSFETVRFEGPDSEKSLAYRWYDANKVVLGKLLQDHLRFAVAYWHSLAMNGSDPFGGRNHSETLDGTQRCHARGTGEDRRGV